VDRALNSLQNAVKSIRFRRKAVTKHRISGGSCHYWQNAERQLTPGWIIRVSWINARSYSWV